MLFFQGVEAHEAAEVCNCAAWGWGCGRVTCFGEPLLHIYTAVTALLVSHLCRDPVPNSFQTSVWEERHFKRKFIPSSSKGKEGSAALE